jgi:hypothetical protein
VTGISSGLSYIGVETLFYFAFLLAFFVFYLQKVFSCLVGEVRRIRVFYD